jgi:eukaryotic-like serine/threonine-protein kinase
LFRQAEKLSPVNGMTVTGLLMSELNLNRLAEARATAESAVSKGLKPAAAPILYLLAFLQNDADEMTQELALGTNSPGYVDVMLSMHSDTEAYYGRMARAREFSRQAVTSARAVNRNESAATWQANAAWREAEFGNKALAQREAHDALTLSAGIDVKTLAAMSFARSGDFARARTLLRDLTQRPDDSLLTCYWLPTIQAAIELGLRKPTRAIALLEAAAPCELGTTAPTYWIAAASPVYLRGEAYLALHQPKQVAAEFQKIIDHRGAVKNSHFGALAILQLARAKALAGDRAGALEAYHGFLELWKGADENVHPWRRARAEFAQLQ